MTTALSLLARGHPGGGGIVLLKFAAAIAALWILVTLGELMIKGSDWAWGKFIDNVFDLGLFKVCFTLALLGFFVWVYMVDIKGI